MLKATQVTLIFVFVLLCVQFAADFHCKRLQLSKYENSYQFDFLAKKKTEMKNSIRIMHFWMKGMARTKTSLN